MSQGPSSRPHDDSDHDPESLIGRLADEMVRRLKRGESIDVKAYQQQHPEVTKEVLEEVDAAVRGLPQWADASSLAAVVYEVRERGLEPPRG